MLGCSHRQSSSRRLRLARNTVQPQRSTEEIPAANSIDPTAAGTEIRVTDRMVSQSLDELLRQSAGDAGGAAGWSGEPLLPSLAGSPVRSIDTSFSATFPSAIRTPVRSI